MDRLALIKAVVGKRIEPVTEKPKGMNATAHPEQPQAARKRKQIAYECRPRRLSQFGIALTPAKHGASWDEKTAVVMFKERQRHEAHALTRIAEKWARQRGGISLAKK